MYGGSRPNHLLGGPPVRWRGFIHTQLTDKISPGSHRAVSISRIQPNYQYYPRVMWGYFSLFNSARTRLRSHQLRRGKVVDLIAIGGPGGGLGSDLWTGPVSCRVLSGSDWGARPGWKGPVRAVFGWSSITLAHWGFFVFLLGCLKSERGGLHGDILMGLG